MDTHVIYKDKNLFILKNCIDSHTTIYTIHYIYYIKMIKKYICDAFLKYVGVKVDMLNSFKAFLDKEIELKPNVKREKLSDYYSNTMSFIPTNRRELEEIEERWSMKKK